MGVKENMLIAGGGAAVIGVGKALTQGVDIPGWMTLLVWVPVIAILGFCAFGLYEHMKTFDPNKPREPEE